MTLQSSGAISFSNIQAEFGNSNPISLSEYYRGGLNVPSGITAIPASGAIHVSNFYGTTKTNLNWYPNWSDLYDNSPFSESASATTSSQTVVGITEAITLRCAVSSLFRSQPKQIVISAVVDGLTAGSVSWTSGESLTNKSFTFAVSDGQTVYFVADHYGGSGGVTAHTTGIVTITNMSTSTDIDTITLDISNSPSGEIIP